MNHDSNSRDYSRIPDPIRKHRAWVGWRRETIPDRDKPTKVLYSVHTGRKASTTDSTSWSSFDEALAAYDAGGYDGIGFVLSTGDPYAFLDCDNAIDPEVRRRAIAEGSPDPLAGLKPWAQFVRQIAPYAYVGLSQSGTGLHVVLRGKPPVNGRRPVERNGATVGGIEIYDQTRLVALTGITLARGDVAVDMTDPIAQVVAEFWGVTRKGGTSTRRATAGSGGDTYTGPVWSTGRTPEAVVEAAQKRHGDRFDALHVHRDLTAYNGDASRADMAYVGMIHTLTGPDPAAIERVMRTSALVRGKWDDHPTYLSRTIAKVLNESDTRPLIELTTENVNTIGDSVVDILEAFNDPPTIFCNSNGEPVTVRTAPDGSAKSEAFTDYQFRERIMRTIRFESPGKATKANSNPPPVDRNAPMEAVRTLLSRRDLPFPPLKGIAVAPAFAEDGSIRLAPGYDPKTQVYLSPTGELDFSDPTLERTPTAQDVRDAVALINEAIGQFPFVSDADRANAAAALLMQSAGGLIRGRFPMIAVEKPTPGTGASLLIATITAPYTGPSGAPGMTHPDDDAEFQKTLTTFHLEGKSYALFDNAEGRFGSAKLAEAITSELMDLRVLNKNQSVRARMPRFWFLTANNAIFKDDLVRRIVPIRLDAHMERPAERTGFRHPLPTWAWDNRARIVRAILTIWKAWLAAGRPMGSQTLGSFESWSQTMGGVLAVAGIDGFLTNRKDFYDRSDIDGMAWRSVVDMWWERFGSEAKTVRDLLTLPAVTDAFGLGLMERDHQKFGMQLRKHRDRPFGDLTIRVLRPNRDKVQTYQLEHREGIIRPPQRSDVAGAPFGKRVDAIDPAQRKGAA